MSDHWSPVARGLATRITSVHPLRGGDVSEAFTARLADGRTVFIKSLTGGPRDLFACEARGLEWLRSAGALQVPEVLAVIPPADDTPGWLVLEHIEQGSRRGAFDEQLGRGLAALHRAGAAQFGLEYDNFIATLEQPNAACPTWSEFLASRRLEPLVRRAVDRGLTPAAWVTRFARLFGRLDGLVGPPEAPARLHGDLWTGNVLVTASGSPCLIDPAVYGGHREVDLAMLQLFGGGRQRVVRAYDEVFPLAPGYEARIALNQLHPLLVHVNLFGRSYVDALDAALAAYE